MNSYVYILYFYVLCRIQYKKISWPDSFYESILAARIRPRDTAEPDISMKGCRSAWGRARIIPWIHNPDANSRHACLDLNGRDISRIITRIFALFFTVSPEIPSAVRVTVSSVWDLNPFIPTLFLNVKNDVRVLF